MAHPYASEAHPNPDPDAPRICIGCGCTDADPCINGRGGTCSWYVPEYPGGNLCTFCARILRFFSASRKHC